MKKISIFLLCFTFIALAFFPLKNADAFTASESEIVMERDSGRILFAKDEKKRLPMASTTKIVTAITVIDNYDLSTVIEVPKETVGVEGSSVYLKAGEKYTVRDLLFGLMLRSGNDCAETLAVRLAGGISEFTAEMKKTAEKCGATDSSFKNPHGLHDDEHYTTALDLGKIACYAMKNEEFVKIVSTEIYTATEISSGEKRVWKNKNKLLKRYEGANGIKTGYTLKAGRCLVSSAIRDGMQTVCVVLNSPQMFERSEELLDYAFANYKMVKIVDKDKFDYVLPAKDLSEEYAIYIKESLYYPVGINEKIEVETDIPKFIDDNVKKDEKIGELKIYCSKQLIFSENIYTLK